MTSHPNRGRLRLKPYTGWQEEIHAPPPNTYTRWEGVALIGSPNSHFVVDGALIENHCVEGVLLRNKDTDAYCKYTGGWLQSVDRRKVISALKMLEVDPEVAK